MVVVSYTSLYVPKELSSLGTSFNNLKAFWKFDFTNRKLGLDKWELSIHASNGIWQ